MQSVRVNKTYAYVNTDRWREAVIRTYTFLDKHNSVDDVVVLPIAVHRALIKRIFGDTREKARVIAVDRSEATKILSPMSVSLPDASEKSIVFVPIVGGITIAMPLPNTLPSAWLTVHALFDDEMMPLLACKKVMNDLTNSLKRYQYSASAVIPLLFNCGWAENAFHTAMAAYSRSEGKDKNSYVRSLSVNVGGTGIGKRLKSAKDVPFGKGDREGYFYVTRSVEDLVAEVMTIAVTKPAGFQPVISRLAQLPDMFIASYVTQENFPAIYDKLHSPQDENSDDEKSQLISREDRKAIEESIKMELEEITAMTHDVRERLVQDLLGKVVIVFAS